MIKIKLNTYEFLDLGNLNKKYPDCGEVTARNLINLICFSFNDLLPFGK